MIDFWTQNSARADRSFRCDVSVFSASSLDRFVPLASDYYRKRPGRGTMRLVPGVRNFVPPFRFKRTSGFPTFWNLGRIAARDFRKAVLRTSSETDLACSTRRDSIQHHLALDPWPGRDLRYHLG